MNEQFTNGWCNLYAARETRGSRPGVYSDRWFSFVRRGDSRVRVWAIITLLVEWVTPRILAQVMTVIFTTSRSVSYMAYIARVVVRVWTGEVSIFDASLFLALRIYFSTECRSNHWPLSIPRRTQIPYFKSRLYTKNPATESWYSF